MNDTKYTFDEIRARIIARGSKAAKLFWLTNEAGFKPEDAEATYRLIMMIAPRPTATRRERREAREAFYELIHFTVGVELECTNVNRDAVRRACADRGIATHDDYNCYNHRDSQSSYKLMSDSSLRPTRGDTYGTCEIVTPVLNDLDSLKTVCDVLNDAGCKVNRTCGMHVHFGAADFTNAQWRRIILNYARIESIIDGFMAPSRKGDGCQWCRSIINHADEIERMYDPTFEDMRQAFRCDRYHKVNLEAFSRHKTIEFRQHAGTINFTKIENWVKFLAGLLTYSIKNEELLTATTVDELPFLSASQKRYFKSRAASLA